MAKTRGGGSQGHDRTRPTTSVRRRDRGVVEERIGDVNIDNDNQQELHDDRQMDQGEGFPRGPSDMSLLVNFADHVAVKLWDGEDRGKLKLVSHGRKLRKFGMPHAEIEVLIQNSGLFSLCNISYEVGGRGLISAFVERWHAETNSFHLPIGEMTITLDDVSSLLHLPILGQFPTYVPLEYNGAATILTELLGVEEAHKSATYVSVSYLLLFNNLRMCGGYAWGATTLTHLYEQLKDASYFNTKQLGSYVTLVQAWIYEHFSGMGRRDINPSYDEVHPRAARYIVAHQICAVGDVRVQLDGLTHDDVIWTPYEDHRLNRLFETIYLFSSHLRLGNLSQRHMPERVLHQFGYEQSIPPSPMPTESPGAHIIDQRWLQFDHHLVTGLTAASSPSACVPEYMSWFRTVSHPYIRRGELGDRPSVVPRRRLCSPNAEQAGLSSQDERAHSGIFRRIVSILQRMIDCRQVTEGTDAYESTEATLHLARSVTDDEAVYTRRLRNVRGRR
ncbi:protein MAINTENANCE OF MERISTEMS-like [Phaseolus vulgaris]|uniref:protein MAINTENANCE OF MERISTEMS-like n=1 Tax=Phaseolus vulgaris TaxID=3885 RepID=UPI0035CA2675